MAYLVQGVGLTMKETLTMTTRTAYALTFSLAVLGGCAAQPAGYGEALTLDYEADEQWLEIAIEDPEAATVTFTHGVDRELRTLTVDTTRLREGGEILPDGEAASLYVQEMDPAFVDEVRMQLLETDRNDRVSQLARAVLLNLGSFTAGSAYKVARQTTSVGASSTVNQHNFDCSYGWFCSCQGVADCNDMFSDGCGLRGQDVCVTYGTVQYCYCWY